jgi:hypothetical protein
VNDNLVEEDEENDAEDGRRGECGWDVRLMWGEAEWAHGVEARTVLEGYGTVPIKDESVNWWCPEGASCSRHVGWQKLQKLGMDKEKDMLVMFLPRGLTR